MKISSCLRCVRSSAASAASAVAASQRAGEAFPVAVGGTLHECCSRCVLALLRALAQAASIRLLPAAASVVSAAASAASAVVAVAVAAVVRESVAPVPLSLRSVAHPRVGTAVVAAVRSLVAFPIDLTGANWTFLAWNR